MIAFYDEILPNLVNKYLKKIGGGKVSSTYMEGGDEILWSIDITDEIKNEVKKGQMRYGSFE